MPSIWIQRILLQRDVKFVSDMYPGRKGQWITYKHFLANSF